MKYVKGRRALVLILGVLLVISGLGVISSDIGIDHSLMEPPLPKETSAIVLSDDPVPAIILESPANNSILRSGSIIDIAITDTFSPSHVLFNWDGLGDNVSISEPYEILLPVGDGQHDLLLYANDTAANWESALFSFVTDDTDPMITSPVDVSYAEGSTGHNILWVLTDANPDCYFILMNQSSIECGFWFSGIEVNINVDGHTPGVYIYKITAFDATCNCFTDTVVVTVLEVTPTTTTTTITTTISTTTTPSLIITTDTTSPPPTIIGPLNAGSLSIALAATGIIIVLNIVVMKRRP
ncbi:MAG: hypothetical protein AM326_03225 [Candidatus Thorarchaeota archaeon SMTZ-45]|nr:MAG: hypothetical protein AM326_03225 [Candidatus Thorarchaeota archaeon SMTZ-45]